MRNTIFFFTIVCVLLMISGCSGGSSNLQGPLLDVGAVESLVIDQAFINIGTQDEYRGQGDFAIYLRDAATGKDMACTSSSDGMNQIAKTGNYYGGLSIPFREISSDHPSTSARFKIMFVEKDSEDCPEPIQSVDKVVGESPELTFDSLIGSPIWALNGMASVVLRKAADPVLTVNAMAASRSDGLQIDELYFKRDSNDGKSERFYIFVDQMVNGQSAYQCQVDDSSMDSIHFGNVVYAAMGFPISCFDPAKPGFADTQVQFGVYVQTDSGPQLVGRTDPKAIGDLIGGREDFVEGEGYIFLRKVVPELFGSSMVRFSDLDAITITSLDYNAQAGQGSELELQAVDSTSGLVVACAGAIQGLKDMDSPGLHEGLAVKLVQPTGQKELFGWDGILFRLVARNDGASCPNLPTGAPQTLAESPVLSSSELKAGSALLSGSGSIKFTQTQ